MKRIISIFAVVFVLAFSVLPCFAVEYSTEFPLYVPISGGAFFEVESSLGKITFICPNNCKNNYFGFSGSGNNICNVTNSTVTGYIYTASGTSYQARFTALGTLEYRINSSSYYEYRDVTITKILNTNVNFIDDKGDRQTDNYFLSKENIFLYTLLLVCASCSVLSLFFSRKRRGN